MEKITSLTIGMALAVGVFLCATSAELVMAAGNQTGASVSNQTGAMANNTGAAANQTGASVSNQSQQSANQTNSTNPLSKIPVIGKLFGGK
ncbi:MAG TPA: hypothetical protein VE089_08915 [Nitrososphaeraceae archaeon]|nr:hypothetical protein [Nitrososphaeraceae archaeon]